MRPGRIERRRYDYTRHGTRALFAALGIATGRVIGKCFARYRAAEFRRFLDEVAAHVPSHFDVYPAMDNDAIHEAPAVKIRLPQRPP